MKKVTNSTFGMMAANRHKKYLNEKGVLLSRILKSGKAGKPTLYEKYGKEKTAQDVIGPFGKSQHG